MLIYQFCSEAKKCNPQMKLKKFTELTMDIQLKKGIVDQTNHQGKNLL